MLLMLQCMLLDGGLDALNTEMQLCVACFRGLAVATGKTSSKQRGSSKSKHLMLLPTTFLLEKARQDSSTTLLPSFKFGKFSKEFCVKNFRVQNKPMTSLITIRRDGSTHRQGASPGLQAVAWQPRRLPEPSACRSAE